MKVLFIIGVVVISFLVLFGAVTIYDKFIDISPTKDDRCRGGHDF